MRIEITDEVIPAAAITAAMRAGADGAVCVFDGMVRDNTRGRKTLHLDYEAYREMALEQMRGLAGEAVTKFGVRDVALVHRLGRLVVGETSVLVVVASAHRGAAFEACRWLIDTLKKTVPIWKKEQFVDGAVWADGEAFPEALGLGEESDRPAPPQRASTLVGNPGADKAHISESRYGAPGVGTGGDIARKTRGTGEAGPRGIDLLGEAAARARVGDVEAFPEGLGVGEESDRPPSPQRAGTLVGDPGSSPQRASTLVGDPDSSPQGASTLVGNAGSDEAHISESRYGAPAPGDRPSDEAHIPESRYGAPGDRTRKVEGRE